MLKKKKKILVVDDEPDIVKVLKFRLLKHGFDVVVAMDGDAAVALARSERPDLMILDMNLPRKTGMEIYQELALGEPQSAFPVIVLTARGEFRSLFKDLKAQGFFAKPFDVDELLKCVDKVLEEFDPKNMVSQYFSKVRQIIIADDDLSARYFLVTTFANNDFKIFTACTAAEMYSCLLESTPVFALVKLGLSGMESIENIKKFRARDEAKNLPLVWYARKQDLEKVDSADLCAKIGLSQQDLNVYADPHEVLNAVQKKLEAKEL